MAPEDRRLHVEICGVVQGVGFRPFVYDLATDLLLRGWVTNTSEGVTTEVQGPSDAVDAFVRRLAREAPPLAFIVEIVQRELSPRPPRAPAHTAGGETSTSFAIRPSQASSSRSALLPPDVCVCDDCLREMLDPADRRYRYPFINCTNCGPRYTIIDDIPYDRDKTTMAGFEMCEACRQEYEDPRNRRFHAQPNACFACGPEVWLADASGCRIPSVDPIGTAAAWLREGKVLAVKGIGGFHLAVDAAVSEAVRRLRRRKHREAKPLAVMCRDMQEVEHHVTLDDASRALMVSRHRPIVVVPRRASSCLAEQVAPGNTDLGVMLPYTPLHVLLLAEGPATLVMTSGNVSEEPIVIGNDEAVDRLGAMVDGFLMHDRAILVRNDDSVVRASSAGTTFLRRSRGYVPLPVVMREPGPSVLGVGAELKNTVCLTKGKMAFLSQHIGDQSNAAAYDAFVQTAVRLQRMIGAQPERLAVDMHPDYATTRWAESLDIPRVAVQHHHAHVASCLAEHQETGPVIGLALDGNGLGTDGAVWGGEVLIADLRSFRRAGHLSYVRMPGGDRAARQPWRMAVSYLMHTYGRAWPSACPAALVEIPEQRRDAVAQLVASGLQAPRTSSMGRLFDGISALCGLFLEARFEAQAAMGLEMAARQGTSDRQVWPVALDDANDLVQIPPELFVRPLIEDLSCGTPANVLAMRFHRTLASALVTACIAVRARTGLRVVAASGGSMQNRLLSMLLIEGLERAGFRVLVHRRVPPNDGGIALGQVAVAQAAR